MSKYIDAEHFRRWVIARWEERDTTNPYPLSGREILDQIEREEYFAADVAEVRHGRWIPTLIMGDRGSTGYTCSVCHKFNKTDSDSCPNCGASMMDEVTE